MSASPSAIGRPWSSSQAISREEGRRRAVQLIFAFYWLLVLEGALRKWGFPHLEELLFFIRVPVAFAVYWVASRHGFWPKLTAPSLSLYLLAAAAFMLGVIQFIAGRYSDRYLVLVAYGWHNYFYYIPLAFVVAQTFRSEDLRRITLHTAGLLIASVPLVVLQFFSPSESPINLGSALDESNQFRNLGAALGFVRPTGLFTSVSGQAHFVASGCALLLAALLQTRTERALHPLALALGLAAVVVMTAFSQSRLLVSMVALTLAAAVIAGLVSGNRPGRAVAWPIALVVLGGVASPILFPTAFEVFEERWTGSWALETRVFTLGIVGRSLYEFYSVGYYLFDTPVIGYLLGLGGNAATQLDWVRLPNAATEWRGYGGWAEPGLTRHIVELGPVLGASFIVFRVGLAVWLGASALRATRGSGDLLPVILFGYVGVVLLRDQITGHGTVNGFTWLFVGLCLAAIRTSSSNPTTPMTTTPTTTTPEGHLRRLPLKRAIREEAPRAG